MNKTWPVVPLTEILKPISRPESVDPEKTYRILGAHWYSEGLYVKDTLPGSLIRADKVYRVEKGDFVYNRLFAWKGSFAVATEANGGCYVSNEFPCFAINRDRADAKFLWRYFSRASAWKEALGLSTGGTPTSRNRLKEEKFLAMTIPLPSLPEQRRIVARIEELAVKINDARTLRSETERHLPTLLLNEAGRLFARLTNRFPDRRFGSFSHHVSSGPRNWAGHYEDRGYRFYRAQDIGTEGKVLDDSKVYIDPPPGEQGRSAMLEPGDILLVITGATVGRVAVFHDGLESGFVNQHVAICRLPSDEVDPEFAVWGLRAPNGKAQLFEQRYGQGKPGLNLTNIRQLHLPFPPLCEQRRMVAQLLGLQAKVNSLKSFQRETAAELAALLPSLLDKAFNGEL